MGKAAEQMGGGACGEHRFQEAFLGRSRKMEREEWSASGIVSVLFVLLFSSWKSLEYVCMMMERLFNRERVTREDGVPQ